MYVNSAYEVLVIILSVTLAVFLILAIIAAVKINQLLDQMKRISDKAEKFANTAESVGEFISASTGPAAFGRFFAAVGEAMRSRKRKDEDNGK